MNVKTLIRGLMVNIKYIFTYRSNSKWRYSNGNMMCSDNIDSTII